MALASRKTWQRRCTGTPTAPTATAGDISTQIATTAFVAASITNSTTPDATTTSKGKLQLTNDLGGTADLPTVDKVGGSTAANINAATTLANSATASNTANSIVKRDANGNFRYHGELVEKFSGQPVRVLLYVASFVFLSLHLLHGFASAFQSVGFRHTKYTPAIAKLGKLYAIAVPALYIFIAVFHFING